MCFFIFLILFSSFFFIFDMSDIHLVCIGMFGIVWPWRKKYLGLKVKIIGCNSQLLTFGMLPSMSEDISNVPPLG
jgi:hypothetical protein